jgi:hypothetical protein
MTKRVKIVEDRLLFVALILVFTVYLTRADLSNGLGEHIQWVQWNEALELAKHENKPLMVTNILIFSIPGRLYTKILNVILWSIF